MVHIRSKIRSGPATGNLYLQKKKKCVKSASTESAVLGVHPSVNFLQIIEKVRWNILDGSMMCVCVCPYLSTKALYSWPCDQGGHKMTQGVGL